MANNVAKVSLRRPTPSQNKPRGDGDECMFVLDASRSHSAPPLAKLAIGLLAKLPRPPKTPHLVSLNR
ncbi:hypothetical protein PROFUN_10654 [Planoprotostelium fungivorum]|uniref:Uncharacterized protein n=1 Tax=Planoprotostelium fungivorum TaxID=1890364 RepID=A0A2P6MV03_9EUKA|nr:hypothetical protein PROFUN_10654 [Planoprotostelium fungivorum]